MPKKKPTSLSDVLNEYAPQGTNDSRWFLVEHQLAHVKICVNDALNTLCDIMAQPENLNEQEVADDCYRIIRGMRLAILQDYATFLSYLSDTDVPDRISRKEL